jgi:hypothetical protein
MKNITTILLSFLLLNSSLFSQDTTDDRDKRWGIGWFQEDEVVINGASFGFYSIWDGYRNTTTNGIRTEVPGLGFFTLFFGASETELDSVYSRTYFDELDADYSEKVNGISLSVTGAVGKINVNGISINGIGCRLQKVNGVIINGACCHLEQQNGLLISGMFNSADKLNGVALSFLYNKVNSGHGFNACIISNNSRVFDGVQISLFNRAKTGRLIQFGLINYIKDNPKGLRILPFINMRFKKGD